VRSSLTLSIIAMVLLGGCSMAPKLDPVSLEQPQGIEAVEIDTAWWHAFDDAQLNTLIDEALVHSDDMLLAIANVKAAEATLGISRAERFPRIDASGSFYRQDTSEESPSPVSGMLYNSYALSGTLSYEFDFWGKYQNAHAAAWSNFLASEADQETFRMTLIGDVTTLYINQIALGMRENVVKESVKAFRESYEYRERQFRYGGTDELTVEQAHALYAGAQLLLGSIVETKALNENALSLLVGREPKNLFGSEVTASDRFPGAIAVPSGLPSDLMQRRPDIQAALERLKASNATIGVAKADYFPSISLTGTYGYSSIDLDKLLTPGASTWGFGPSLNLPLFDFGRIENNVKRAEAQKEIAMITYAKTIKTAFKEVRDALDRLETIDIKIKAQDEELNAYQKVLDLAIVRYDTGYGDYLNVLEAKRSLLSARLNTINLNAELLQNQVLLFKALGGGWKLPTLEASS